MHHSTQSIFDHAQVAGFISQTNCMQILLLKATTNCMLKVLHNKIKGLVEVHLQFE